MNKQDENAKLTERALWYLDKLLLVVPNTSNFSIESSLGKMNLTESECVEMYTLSKDIKKLLIDRLGYAELEYDKLNFTLTELGRKVKSKGGHFKYLENLKEKEFEEIDRQILSDKKLTYDVENSKYTFKTKKCTFWFSVISIISAIVVAILKLFEWLQPKH